MAQARVLKRRRGVIGSNGKEQLVNLARKVGASARSSDQASLGIDTNGNDNTATCLRAAKVSNDFLTRKLAHTALVSSQPFGECFPSVPPRHFDCAAPFGIAQPYKSEIQLQRSDQHIGKPGGNDRRFSSHPRRRDRRKCYQLSERCSQLHTLSMRFCGHLVRHAGTFANRPSLPQLEEKLIGRNEERVLLQDAADNYEIGRASCR